MPATLYSKTPDGMQVVDLGGGSLGAPVGPFIPRSDNEPERATFGCSVFNITPVANATDIIGIVGSASKVIRLKSVIISGTATSASNVGIFLVKRTTANTLGTPANQTVTSHDTIDGASVATVPLYGANPTTGTGTTLHSGRLNLAPAANGSIDRIFWQWAWLNDKAPVIRGAAQSLMINFNGQAVPAGGALDIDFEWTEE